MKLSNCSVFYHCKISLHKPGRLASKNLGSFCDFTMLLSSTLFLQLLSALRLSEHLQTEASKIS